MLTIVATAGLTWALLHNRTTTTEAEATPGFLLADLNRIFGKLPPEAGRLSHGPPGLEPPGNAAPVMASFAGGPDLELEAKLERRVRAAPSAETLHARGLLRLVQGRLDQAIDDLTAARLHDPKRTEVLVDLTVAYLEIFRTAGDPRDLLLAADLALDAFERDRGAPPAAYNLALALEGLQLSSNAAEVLDHYLTLDSSSEWAEEARRRLSKIRAPTLADRWAEIKGQIESERGRPERSSLFDPPRGVAYQLLEYAAEGLVPEWVDAVERGRRGEVEAIYLRLREIGKILSSSARDETITLTLSSIQPSTGGTPELDAVLDGLAAWGEGTSFIRAGDCTAADRPLALAEAELRTVGSPLAEWAAYHRAVCAYYDRIPGAVSRFRSLRERVLAQEASLPMLLGRVEWMLGLATTGSGDWAAALPLYHSAAERFRSAGDATGQAGIYTLLTEAHKQLGQSQEAWTTRLASLAAVAALGEPKYRVRALNESLLAVVAEDRLAVARFFQDELVREARRWDGGDAGLASALVTSAQLFRRLDRNHEAEAALDEAARCTDRLPFGPQRTRLTANVEVERGLLQVELDPSRGVALLTESMARFREIGYHTRTPALLNSRARALLALGDESRAEADLERALILIERRRETPEEEALRISFFETFQESYDAMVRFQASRRGGAKLAFAFADLSRGRALQDRLARVLGSEEVEALGGGNFADPSIVERLQAALPPRVALVQYSVLPEALLIWVVRSDHFELVRHPIAARDLRRAVELFARMLDQGVTSAQLEDLGAPLFAALVAPIRNAMKPASKLVLVPDRFLANVPFAALIDPSTGRHLIETHALSFSPTARLLILDEESGRQGRSEPLSVLAIAADAFDRGRFPGLDLLPNAETEARAVAGLYPQADVLAGVEATPSSLQARLGHRPVLHFAGHAVASGGGIDDMRLVLAPEESDPRGGALTTVGLQLDDLELVFLSACSTLVLSSLGEREGIAGIARELLAAGVSAVVASSRPVADRPAGELAVAFHRALAAGADPAAALQAAQLDLMKRHDPTIQSPASWATFQLYRRSFSQPNRGKL